ncbi:hypothetical protein Ahy_A03g014124 isoform B [Arachis hypogaea]|uniref:Protein FAR1-RELATED SEQUENCE n=1 Tax=Arachis hypogaea TaxID=3818 RepID=A0A445DX09_ARAHY|nr:hypothetical protein Ahy_A03g014124 isoform B [Arachis hypogaea]
MGKAPMRSALETALPNTRHRWCIWHILKKISHKQEGYYRVDQLNTCMERIMFESNSKDSFGRDWHDFIENQYGCCTHGLTYAILFAFFSLFIGIYVC